MEHLPLLKMSGSHMVSSPKISQRFVTYIPTSNSHAAGNFRTPPRVKPVVRGRSFSPDDVDGKAGESFGTMWLDDFFNGFFRFWYGSSSMQYMPGIYNIHMYILPLGYPPTRTKKKSIDICVLRPAIAERKNLFIIVSTSCAGHEEVGFSGTYETTPILLGSWLQPKILKKCSLKKWWVRRKWPTVGG